MDQGIKKLFLMGLIFALLTSIPVTPAIAGPKNTKSDLEAGDMVYDLLVCRTSGLVRTTLGAAFWVVTGPVTVLGGNHMEAWKVLVDKPAKYTFGQPLGKIKSPYKD
ncbi:MAG: hypothetical protein ABII06_02235 [Pseudomonadota bacterium]